MNEVRLDSHTKLSGMAAILLGLAEAMTPEQAITTAFQLDESVKYRLPEEFSQDRPQWNGMPTRLDSLTKLSLMAAIIFGLQEITEEEAILTAFRMDEKVRNRLNEAKSKHHAQFGFIERR